MPLNHRYESEISYINFPPQTTELAMINHLIYIVTPALRILWERRRGIGGWVRTSPCGWRTLQKGFGWWDLGEGGYEDI